jgi:hypothetical protein
MPMSAHSSCVCCLCRRLTAVDPRQVHPAPSSDIKTLQDSSAPARESELEADSCSPRLPPSNDEEGVAGALTEADWARIRIEEARRASEERQAHRASQEGSAGRPGSGQAGSSPGSAAVPHPPGSMRPSAGSRPVSHLGASAAGMRAGSDAGFRPASQQGTGNATEGPAVAAAAAALHPFSTSTDGPYRPSSGRPEQVQLVVGSRPVSGLPAGLVSVAEEASAIARISTAGSNKSGSSHQGVGTVAEVLAAAEGLPEGAGGATGPLAAPSRRDTGQGLILGAPASSLGALRCSLDLGSRPNSTQAMAEAAHRSCPGFGPPASAAAAAAGGSNAESRRSSHLGGGAVAGLRVHSFDVPVSEGAAEGVEAAAGQGEPERVEGGRESPRLSRESPDKVRSSQHGSAKHAWAE